eukprot:gene25145-biopygen10437
MGKSTKEWKICAECARPETRIQLPCVGSLEELREQVRKVEEAAVIPKTADRRRRIWEELQEFATEWTLDSFGGTRWWVTSVTKRVRLNLPVGQQLDVYRSGLSMHTVFLRLEGSVAAKHIIQHDPKSPDIRSRVVPPQRDLLLLEARFGVVIFMIKSPQFRGHIVWSATNGLSQFVGVIVLSTWYFL